MNLLESIYVVVHSYLITVLAFSALCDASNDGQPPVFLSEKELMNGMQTLPVQNVLVLSNGNNKECKATIERLEIIKILGDISQFSEEVIGVQDLAVAVLEDKDYERKHSLRGCPNIILYRNLIPIVYDGENLHMRFNQDEISDWIQKSLQPSSVQHLSEETFEHLTQASTGATTGDWLVWFHDADHLDLTAVWEAVAARLKYSKVVGEVDTTLNPKLAKRFELTEPQHILLFRQGRVYSYTADVFHIHALANFAEISYKNFKSKPVKPPLSPFDEKVEEIVKCLKDSDYGLYALVSVTGVLFISIIYQVCKENKELADSEKKDN